MGQATETQRKRNAAYMRRRNATPEGQAYRKLYQEKLRTPDGKKKRAEQAKKYYRSPLGQEYKMRARLSAYGLTKEQYDEIAASQLWGCAICGVQAHAEKKGQLHIDHDHTTNQVRGLLCSQCNVGLGMFSDSPERLRLAAAYLEQSNGT